MDHFLLSALRAPWAWPAGASAERFQREIQDCILQPVDIARVGAFVLPIAFNSDTFVDGNVVLNADVVADLHVVADEHILSQGAVSADLGSITHMYPMPNAGVVTYSDARIDDSSLMRLVSHSSVRQIASSLRYG